MANIVMNPAIKNGTRVDVVAWLELPFVSALPVCDAPAEPDPEPDVAPEPEWDVIPLPVGAEPEAEELNALNVAAAANSCSDEYVWQLEDDTCVGVYGTTPKGPLSGWNQVVVTPSELTYWPGCVMSVESQTVYVPLMLS